MSSWKVVKVGEVCDINKNSYSIKENWSFINYLDTGNITENKIENIQYFDTGNDKIPSRAKRKIFSNDIIYSTVRPNQKHYGIIKEPLKNMLVSTGFAVINGKSGVVDNKFLYYYLIQENIVNMLHTIGEHSTSAYPSIKPSDIESIDIFIPPLKEQKAIADTLSCLDDKIELNNKINKNLEEMAQAIFKSWFVDFEPFQDGEFEDSELGRIPKGWRVGTIDDIAQITSGKRPSLKSENKNAEMNVPVIGASSIMAFTNKSLYNEKILVIGRVGTHGIVQRLDSKCWPSDNTLVIMTDNYEYVYQILCNIDYTSLNRGSTQPLITQTDLKNSLIIIPPNEVISDFEELVSKLMIIWHENIKQNRNLVEIRDSLLPKLMSGEIRVPVEGVQ